MTGLIFFLFVLVLIAALGFSGLIAHTRLQLSAGWWAGIMLALLVVGSQHSEFQSLPTYIDSSGCTRETRTDWGSIAEHAVEINWYVLFVGLIGGIIFLEVLERVLDVPNRLLAFLLLFVAFTSLGSLLYIFLIRKLSYLVFSFVMGSTLGGLLRKAFKDRNDKHSQ